MSAGQQKKQTLGQTFKGISTKEQPLLRKAPERKATARALEGASRGGKVEAPAANLVAQIRQARAQKSRR